VKSRIVLSIALALALVIGSTVPTQSVRASERPATSQPAGPAADALAVKREAEASVWVPPAASPTPIPAFADPSLPWSRSVVARVGAETGPDLRTFMAGDVPLAVDAATGNLVVGGRDVSLAGAGSPLILDRVYDNGVNASTGLGTGWSTNFDRGIRFESSAVVFYSASGDPVLFPAEATGGYSSAGGATVTKVAESPERTYLLRQNSGDTLYFSANGYLTADLDLAGRGFVVRYDTSGRITLAQQTASGRSLSFDYAGGALTSVTDSAGRKTTYSQDAAGRLGQVTSPTGGTTTFSYDTHGRLVTVTVPSSATASGTTDAVVAYDGSGRVASVTQESTSTLWGARPPVSTKFSYAAGSTIVSDALGIKTTYGFDAENRLTTVTDSGGHVSKADYDGGTVTSITDSAGETAHFSYDSVGNPAGVSMPGGASAKIDYQASPDCQSSGGDQSAPKCFVDAEGNRVSIDYNGDGSVSDVRDSIGVVTQFGYSSDASSCMSGRGYVCSETDGNGRTVQFSYSAAGDLAGVGTRSSAGIPLAGSTNYGRDSLGRIVSVTRVGGGPRGGDAVTSISYNRADEIVHTVSANGDETWRGYNPDGTTAFAVGDGALTRYDYDSRGLLTAETSERTAGAVVDGSTATVTYDHDADGNLTSRKDDSGTTGYIYHENLLVRLDEPGSNCGTHPGGRDSGCVRFSYDAEGRELQRRFAGGAVQTTIYDSSGRPTVIAASARKTGQGISLSYSYSNAVGEPTNLVQSRTAVVKSDSNVISGSSVPNEPLHDSTVTSYGYDARERLTSAVETAGTGKPVQASWAYTYDGADNRLSETRSGNTGGGTEASTAPSTITYAYNRLNQIVSTSADTAKWAYDGQGDQTMNGITGAATDNSVSAAQSTDAVPESTLQSFITLPSGDVIGFRDASGSHYYGKDITGSVVAVFDADGSYAGGISYSPFGELRAMAPGVAANPVRYGGGFADPATPDVYRYGERSYDATIGRFSAPNPAMAYRSALYSLPDPVNLVTRGTGWSVPVDLAHLASYALVVIALSSCFFGTYFTCSVMGAVAVLAAVVAPLYALTDDPTTAASRFGAEMTVVLIALATMVVTPLVRAEPTAEEEWDFGFGVIGRFFEHFGFRGLDAI
jgi:RHS repeat-associated protein